jgi:phosphohistidine phosphatase
MTKMNEIILWRHAEAEDGEPDLERTLTAKGHKQAAKMAAWLDRQLPANCRILCSPAQRTLQTAKALERKFRITEALAPDADLQEALALCQPTERGEPLLLVGHQPLLGRMASMLLSGVDQSWTLRKGAILWVAQRKQAETDEESKVLYLKAALSPELAGK